MPEMRSVFSSHVDGIGYDPETQELHVQYAGNKTKDNKLAVYYGVPPEIAHQVMTSASIGEALHEYVRGAFDHEYR